LEKRNVPRILGTLAIYIIAILIVAVIIYLLVPVALVELGSVLSNSGGIMGSIIENFGAEGAKVFDSLIQGLNDLTAGFLGGKITIITILSRFLGGLFFAAIVFVISFYLTVGRDGVEKFLVTILPYQYHENVLTIYERVRRKISLWFRGQLLLSLIVGLAVFIGLWILGVKYSLVLGIAAGLFELIPYVGPIFSGSLAVLFALTESVTLGLYALILFIVIQQIESHLLIPTVMGRTTNLNPVIVLVALLMGGKIFGLIGIILAVPLAVLVQEVLRDWSVSHRPALPPETAA
ncbi:MAG: AI-2E family transporter, partial [bacterium]|nr:AI-2E family transporter [bacterium]